MRVTNRFAAFAIHLAISFVMFLVLAAVIKFLWYPGVLFATEGGWDGIKLIAGVDLVIGPTLTLMVYNVAKKELKRDLAIIGLLQAACIVGGMGTVAYSRPIAVIYAAGTFFVATQQRFDNHDIDTNQIELLQQRKPVWITVDIPEDEKERLRFLQDWAIKGGFDLATSYYQPYDKATQQMKREGFSLDEAEKRNLVIPDDITNKSAVRIYNLQTRYGTFNVAVNTDTGELLSTVKRQP